MNVKDWIKTSAIPLEGKLSAHNAATYEKFITDYGIPIVLLFLALSDEMNIRDKTILGGMTGGIFNEVLIQELKLAAKSFIHRAVFACVDGWLCVRRQHDGAGTVWRKGPPACDYHR